ncbi:MAG: hypothetical protein QF681_04265 [Vicinamibacterales bacterium]|nr:hypothetical protein [Vicinamibacterales bacterium]
MQSARDPLRFAPAAVLLLASAGLGVALATSGVRDVPESEIDTRPVQVGSDGYVSSDTCKACHPSEYDSWFGSFHRTMTQVATPETVRADFDGVRVENTHGQPMLLERDGDKFWAEFDDPGWEGPEADRPRITRQVVMITGSHHQNIYWYETGHDRGLNVLPSVYLIKEQRWASRSAVVLHPPQQSLAMLNGHWNAICIVCHTTQGKTAFDTPYRSEAFELQAIDTTVAEFGIACESCHGPAEAHIAANQNPLRRYSLHLGGDDDPTIVQPSLLDPQRSSQVCGQCHSVWEFYDAEDERQANWAGLPYRPGDELRDTRFIAQPSVDRSSPEIRTLANDDPEFVRGSFWPDGMVRVSGREYNGLIDSPCFRDATEPEHTLTCFSCHTLHKTAEDPRPVSEWADTHQVSTGMAGNDACLQCHEPMRDDVTVHTRHLAESSGSNCYNCHMPYTSYGLLKTERSHTISSPTATETVELGRPNACNLCHLDRTVGWTADHLHDWYDTPVPELGGANRTVAAALLWILSGDAGLRALTAQSMGWAPAQEASGTSWMVPHLGEALGDRYDAVRFIAARSLRSLPGYADLAYDFDGPEQERVDVAVQVLSAWRASPASRQRREPELLVDADGDLRVDAMRRLFDQRTRRPLFLRE